MKRSLFVCAVALLAVAASTAQAAIDVQLNLRYTNPTDPSAGGTWDLLVESDNADGVAGIVAVIDGISDAAAAGTTGWNVFETQTISGVTEIVAGSDLVSAAVDVGLSGGTGVVADDLFPSGSPWEHSSLVASGNFGATRPTFSTIPSISATTAGNSITAAGVVNDPAPAIGRMSVRGDGVGAALDNLYVGDVNRDGVVSLSTDIFPALANVGAGCSTTTTCTFDTGDMNNDNIVSLSTDIFPSLGNVGMPPITPPAITAVPEPTSLVLTAVVGVMLASSRRRNA